MVFPVRRQSGVGLDAEQAPPLPRGVFAEQLVVGVLRVRKSLSFHSERRRSAGGRGGGTGPHLDDAVVVVGEVRQRGPALAQRVVAGVGVVVVVAVRNLCRPPQNTNSTSSVKLSDS